MRIGIDFDNTIAGYDYAFVSLAEEMSMIDKGQAKTKKQLRDILRSKPQGEENWQRLQGRAYGAEIDRAILMDGFEEFVKEAKISGDEIYIVSHKTMFGHFDNDRINLREAALRWMRDRDFFSESGLAINSDQIWFLKTREEKISRISELNPDWFIDDLPEVLNDSSFPSSVKKILFANSSELSVETSLTTVETWSDIKHMIYS